MIFLGEFSVPKSDDFSCFHLWLLVEGERKIVTSDEKSIFIARITTSRAKKKTKLFENRQLDFWERKNTSEKKIRKESNRQSALNSLWNKKVTQWKFGNSSINWNNNWKETERIKTRASIVYLTANSAKTMLFWNGWNIMVRNIDCRTRKKIIIFLRSTWNRCKFRLLCNELQTGNNVQYFDCGTSQLFHLQ